MSKPYPKYEKVDKDTIKIIMERVQDVPIQRILNNREVLLAQKAEIEKQLENIAEIIKTAKKLGIDTTLKLKQEDKNFKKGGNKNGKENR